MPNAKQSKPQKQPFRINLSSSGYIPLPSWVGIEEGMSSSWSDSPYWNIVLLALAWALTLSTSTLLTTVGPFSATELGASKTLSAFTIGIFLIGAAISSVPSGWLFRRYGRYCGFSLGCLLQFTGSTLGIIALATTQIEWLYMGCLSIGLAQGLGQFYRFSAVEVTPKELKSRAVTYVLSGGILAAFLGPSAANYTIHMLGDKYMGSYLMIAVFATLNQAVISLVKFPARESALTTAVPVPVTPTENTTNSSSVHHSKDMETHTHTENPLTRSTPSGERVKAAVVSAGPSKGRTRWQIVSQPQFLLSCSIATLAHTIMVMLMSNVTIAMKDSGFAFSTTSLVMEVHFFAMFCPGFVTGKLIESYGSFLVAMVGGLIFGGSSAVFASAPGQLWSYFAGMILLGVAWNLAFSAGTVMLTGCYHPSEATEVQAVNDFVLFTIAGLGSVLSGEIFSVYGWLYLVYITSALMGLYVCLFAWALMRVTRIEVNQDDSEDERRDRFSTALRERSAKLQAAAASASARSVSQSQRVTTFSFATDATGMDRGTNIRTVSVSQKVYDMGRTISFSIANDPTAEMVDESHSVRTMSVA